MKALLLFWSPALWRDVGQRWRGIGLAFMFLLLLLSWIPAFVVWTIGYSDFVQNEAQAITSQIPPVTIKDGVASADVEQPYYIRDPETNHPVACIDTTGTVKEPTAATPVLLTKDSFITYQEGGRIQKQSLGQVKSLVFDGGDVLNLLRNLKPWIPIVGYPVMVVASLAFRLSLMLLYGAIGLGVASATSARLTFAACMRLAAISMAPVILIDTILWPLGMNSVGCAWIVGGIILTVVMLILTIRANAGGGMAPGGGYAYQPMPAGAAPAWPGQSQWQAQPPEGYSSQHGIAPPPPPPPGGPA